MRKFEKIRATKQETFKCQLFCEHVSTSNRKGYIKEKKEQEDKRQGRLRPLITGKIKSDDPKRVVKVEAELLA